MTLQDEYDLRIKRQRQAFLTAWLMEIGMRSINGYDAIRDDAPCAWGIYIDGVFDIGSLIDDKYLAGRITKRLQLTQKAIDCIGESDEPKPD